MNMLNIDTAALDMISEMFLNTCPNIVTIEFVSLIRNIKPVNILCKECGIDHEEQNYLM